VLRRLGLGLGTEVGSKSRDGSGSGARVRVRTGAVAGVGSSAWRGERVRDEVIVMGDSIIRQVDRVMCRKGPKKTTMVCLSGKKRLGMLVIEWGQLSGVELSFT